MSHNKFDNDELGDSFEPTWRDNEPTFTCGLPEFLILGGLVLFGLGLAIALSNI